MCRNSTEFVEKLANSVFMEKLKYEKSFGDGAGVLPSHQILVGVIDDDLVVQENGCSGDKIFIKIDELLPLAMHLIQIYIKENPDTCLETTKTFNTTGDLNCRDVYLDDVGDLVITSCGGTRREFIIKNEIMEFVAFIMKQHLAKNEIQ